MKRLAILLSGRGSNFEAIAANVRSGHIPADIAVVLSNKPDARGLARARELDLRAIALPSSGVSRDAYDQQLAETLAPYKPDLICLAGYMRVITPAFIDKFRWRILNIHPSLLPSFPGLDAPGQAVQYGVRISGCTVHFVDESVDGGPIIAQAAVAVKPDDTPERLAARILEQEHRIYSEAITRVLSGKYDVIGRRVVFR